MNGLKYVIENPPITTYYELECNFLLLKINILRRKRKL